MCSAAVCASCYVYEAGVAGPSIPGSRFAVPKTAAGAEACAGDKGAVEPVVCAVAADLAATRAVAPRGALIHILAVDMLFTCPLASTDADIQVRCGHRPGGPPRSSKPQECQKCPR